MRVLLRLSEGRASDPRPRYPIFAHPRLHSGERLPGRLRWSQAKEGFEGTRCSGYSGLFARLARQPGQRARVGARGGVGRGPLRSDRRIGGIGLRGSGLHRREFCLESEDTPHRPVGSQARGGQERICVVAASVGGGARFRQREALPGATLSAVGKDYERLPDTLFGLHFVAFACLFLQQRAGILGTGL